MAQQSASSIMEKLYGKERSDKVYDRLESLNPKFNRAVQDIAYDYFWALPGLSLRDKSFVTLVSLIVLHREEQTKIHYYGFLNADGTKEELMALLKYLERFVNVDIAAESLAEVLKERNENVPNAELLLTLQDEEMAHLAAVIAIGDEEEMQAVMQGYLTKHPDDLEKIHHVLMHQIVYCGFPVAMNGFAMLQTLL
jgi:alkylhydroperoxidase/carboxymuconolactone decarboxylase family protein YurZ